MVGGEEPAERCAYSKAFENFVAIESGSEDVVGLVAYALYKQAVREEAVTSGEPPSRLQRDPSQTTVRTYRAAAEQSLTKIVQTAIEAATPDIERSSLLDALDNVSGSIKNHVTERTTFVYALLTNIFAWLITLAIATLVIFLAGRPAIEQTLANTVDKVSTR